MFRMQFIIALKAVFYPNNPIYLINDITINELISSLYKYKNYLI